MICSNNMSYFRIYWSEPNLIYSTVQHTFFLLHLYVSVVFKQIKSGTVNMNSFYTFFEFSKCMNPIFSLFYYVSSSYILNATTHHTILNLITFSTLLQSPQRQTEATQSIRVGNLPSLKHSKVSLEISTTNKQMSC